MIESIEIASVAAKSADDKKARDILLIDLKGMSLVTDYFVICSGTSITHIQAIAQAVADEMEKQKMMPSFDPLSILS